MMGGRKLFLHKDLRITEEPIKDTEAHVYIGPDRISNSPNFFLPRSTS